MMAVSYWLPTGFQPASNRLFQPLPTGLPTAFQPPFQPPSNPVPTRFQPLRFRPPYNPPQAAGGRRDRPPPSDRGSDRLPTGSGVRKDGRRGKGVVSSQGRVARTAHYLTAAFCGLEFASNFFYSHRRTDWPLQPRVTASDKARSHR